MITHIFLKEVSVFNFSQRNPISVKIASNIHIYDMDIYEFIMPDEMVMQAVETACSFFDLPEAPVINSDGVCLGLGSIGGGIVVAKLIDCLVPFGRTPQGKLFKEQKKWQQDSTVLRRRIISSVHGGR